MKKSVWIRLCPIVLPLVHKLATKVSFMRHLFHFSLLYHKPYTYFSIVYLKKMLQIFFIMLLEKKKLKETHHWGIVLAKWGVTTSTIFYLYHFYHACSQKKNPKASIQKKMILSAIKDLIYDIWLFLASSNWSRQCMNNIHGIVNNVVFNAMYVTMHVV